MAIVNPVPVEIAKKCGAEIIIAVDVGEDLSKENPAHFFGVVKRGLQITHRTLSDHVTRDADVLIRMDFRDLGMFSDRFNKEIYEHGCKVTRALLPVIERVIQERLSTHHEEVSPSWLMITPECH